MGPITSIFSSDDVTFNIGTASGAEEESLTLARSDFVNLVDSCIIYPRDQSALLKEMKEAEKDGVVLEYHCPSGFCSYDDALRKLTAGPNAAEIKACGVLDLTREIVHIIADNPNRFPANGSHGYVFQTVGRPYLFLRNATKDGPVVNRVGFLDLTNVKKQLHYKQLKKQDAGTRTQDHLLGGAFGVLFILTAQKVARHLK